MLQWLTKYIEEAEYVCYILQRENKFTAPPLYYSIFITPDNREQSIVYNTWIKGVKCQTSIIIKLTCNGYTCI